MKSAIKKVASYIFRNWDDEQCYTHAGLRLLPPFFYELLSYVIALVLLYHLGVNPITLF